MLLRQGIHNGFISIAHCARRVALLHEADHDERGHYTASASGVRLKLTDSHIQFRQSRGMIIWDPRGRSARLTTGEYIYPLLNITTAGQLGGMENPHPIDEDTVDWFLKNCSQPFGEVTCNKGIE